MAKITHHSQIPTPSEISDHFCIPHKVLNSEIQEYLESM